MGTLVTIQVLDRNAGAQQSAYSLKETVGRALDWFRRVEECCTRFDERSELRRLTARVGVPVPASDILYEAVQFSIAVANETGGAFDPTVGDAMEALGFNQEYSTGRRVRTALKPDDAGTYRDVQLDPGPRTITLNRPLVLDLGAVAKGLAVDMAARELQGLRDFVINAGGDLYLGGHNSVGASWSVGIRHPRHSDELLASLRVADRAVCTSGDYERKSHVEPDSHHILDPRKRRSARAAASATVVAPTAMAADALATAAFVLGPAEGIKLLERLGVDGLIVSPELEQYATRGMQSDYQLKGPAVLPDSQGPPAYYSGDPVRPGHAL